MTDDIAKRVLLNYAALLKSRVFFFLSLADNKATKDVFLSECDDYSIS